MPDEQKKTKEQIEQEKLEELRKKEEETNSKLKQIQIQDIESACYMEMDTYIDMIKHGSSYGVIIEGDGGTGKTWRAMNHLKEVQYSYTDSYTTPQALYIWLYHHRDEDVLVIDDCAGFMNNEKVLAFLKGGLWHVGENKNRIIHYMTPKPIRDANGQYVPSVFTLSAKLIIITNHLNIKNPHVLAVLSRVDYCKIVIDHDEMISIMGQIAERDYENLTYDERIEVFNYLKEKTTIATEHLNIRSLIKCFNRKIYSNAIGKPDFWKKLAELSILKVNPAYVLIKELEEDKRFVLEEDRCTEFCKRTGLTRPTYFRYKKRLNKIEQSDQK